MRTLAPLRAVAVCLVALMALAGPAGAALDCTSAQTLSCPSGFLVATMGPGTNNVSSYCGTHTGYVGAEAAYVFTLASPQEITVTLNDGLFDADLFVVPACDAAVCVSASTLTGADDQVRVCLDTGTYYAVVDTHSSATFQYAIGLQCVNCVPIRAMAPCWGSVKARYTGN